MLLLGVEKSVPSLSGGIQEWAGLETTVDQKSVSERGGKKPYSRAQRQLLQELHENKQGSVSFGAAVSGNK